MRWRRLGGAILNRWAVAQSTSRLGREIYALAGLVAVAPIAVVAAIVFVQVEQTFHDRAETALEGDVRAFGYSVQERLLSASEIVYQLGNNDGPALGEIPPQLTAYAVFDEAGVRIHGDPAIPASLARGFDDPSAAKLVIDASTEVPGLFLLRKAGKRIAVGRISSRYLWRSGGLPDSIAFCAVTSGLSRPLYCPAAIPDRVLSAVAADDRMYRSTRWDYGGEAYLGASWVQGTVPQLIRPPIEIVASVPAKLALSDLSVFRGLYIPTLCAVIALALVGSLVYARRILHPLAKMLDVTKKLTERDVWGRADFRRQAEFKNLAEGLRHMADDLAQQFNVRETLSEIDQAILSGADTNAVVDLVLQHIVESIQCRRSMVTILGRDEGSTAVAASMSRGHPVPRKSELEVDDKARRWLEAHLTGELVSYPKKGGPADPFVAFDTPYTYVLPIVADGRPAAALSIMTKDGFGLDDIQKGHIQDLAGRLAVALEAVEKSDKLRRKAYFDDLTGLPNRDFCFNRLDQALKQAKHLDGEVAVMFIDLDGFKGINDTLGHIVGDELIRQAAFRLSSCVGEASTIGRLGGDEFAVVIPNPVDGADPDLLAEQVLAAIGEPFMIGKSQIHISASIGIARYPEDGETRADLLRKADTAMYRAKESGRGRSVTYSHTMGIKVDKRIRLEADLRRALENDEFRVFYQPQMDMRTGQVVSAEALVRWLHPERGLILPGEFVPVAEESGHIAVLGGWVMSAACRQLAQWQDAGFNIERVSVNVSVGQFRHKKFIDEVETCLLNLHFAANALEIELTESVFVEDLKQARSALERLKATGVSISIDDFGTGYSSLGYLKHLTFDVVKIDQSFIHEVPGDKESEAIIQAVLAMCHTLGKQVVAEGIETDRQFEYLRKAGVDIGQGYRIGRPLPADEFAAFMSEVEQQARRRLAKVRA